MKTTRQGLQERQDAPQVLNNSEELLNSKRLQTNSNVNSPVDSSKPLSHLGCGYNSRKRGRMSAKHNVFVLDVEGNPLTPTTNTSHNFKVKEAALLPNARQCGIRAELK